MFFYLIKGAVISSEATPDKNKISTDTLTYSDIQNKAEYSASSIGVNLDTRKGTEAKNAGLTPDIGIPASGDASSTTQSAISPGTIEVRSNPQQDLSNLSRDPIGALNALGQIFDKKTVQERQELAKVFGEVAYEEVHKIAKANGWDEGSLQKIALHAFVGAIMADLGGGNALSGAVGAGVNEAILTELAKKFEGQPDLLQWASAIVGSAAATVVGGEAQTGGSTAASGTKNNWFFIPPAIAALGEVVPYAAGTYLVATPEGRKILDNTGQVLATWVADAGGFVDGYGNYLGNKWDDISSWVQKQFNPPATNTTNPSIGGTTTDSQQQGSSSPPPIASGDPNSGTSTTIPLVPQDNNPVIEYNAGDQTPGGKTFTDHAAQRANERGFGAQTIDSIIANNKNSRVKEIDSDTGEVTWRYQDNRGNTVITSEWGDRIVTVYSYPESANNGNYIPKK